MFLTVAISACGAIPPALETPQRTDTIVLHERESIPGASPTPLLIPSTSPRTEVCWDHQRRAGRFLRQIGSDEESLWVVAR